MPNPEEQADAAAEVAARWVARHDRGLTAAERSDFERWCEADPRHAAEFERVRAGWWQLAGLCSVSAFAEEAEVIAIRARRRQARRRSTVVAGTWLAAAAAVALLLPGPPRVPKTSVPAESVQVLVSSSRRVELPDGSVAMLNGASRIEAAFTATERRVRLLEGEALFTVVKNPVRPFLVTAGPVTVRAVGTAFNVRLGGSAVEVLVTEGRVRVDDAAEKQSLLPAAPADAAEAGVLTKGQRAIVKLAADNENPAGVELATLASYEIEEALSWQQTRVVFDDTPFEEVIAAFNRYNERRLILGDQALRTRRITGVFRADNLDGFVRLLEAGSDVRVESRSGRETVLYTR